ncbi:hypothetical protein [Streptomyces sp. NPDC093149]|uniref:hypothetical protein n=1 Tax=Streptomyces sp. NPDC093149 TaxID=3366031 RepID=UPI0037F81F3D
MLPYVYRVTKYDPADRDQHGHYAGTEPATSDHGPVEAAYLHAVAAFAGDTGVDQLAIREPQLSGFAHFGLEPPVDDHGLANLFPAGPTGFHDGALVPIAVGLELVRAMLRDSGAWCRLETEGALAVHVGWDQYLYVGSSRPCEAAPARTRSLGLFPERLDASPYDFAPDDPTYVQRPADADFWARLQYKPGAEPDESTLHIVCALGPNRGSWTAPLDALRPTSGDDTATVRHCSQSLMGLKEPGGCSPWRDSRHSTTNRFTSS